MAKVIDSEELTTLRREWILASEDAKIADQKALDAWKKYADKRNELRSEA